MSEVNTKLKMKHLSKFCPLIFYLKRHIIQNDYKIMPPTDTDSFIHITKLQNTHRSIKQ